MRHRSEVLASEPYLGLTFDCSDDEDALLGNMEINVFFKYTWEVYICKEWKF